MKIEIDEIVLYDEALHFPGEKHLCHYLGGEYLILLPENSLRKQDKVDPIILDFYEEFM